MIEIIPALDIFDGKCVRLSQGDFSRKTEYRDDPLDAALRFRDVGLRRLHMVDLEGARDGKPRNLVTLEKVASGCGMSVDFGGGVRSDVDVANAFSAGAAMVSVTSVAVNDPDKFVSWAERFGPDKFLLGADTRAGTVAANGWRTDTGLPVVDFVRRWCAAVGVRDVFVTDIGRDGMLTGPNTEMYQRLASELENVRLIASGGVGSLADVNELAAVGCTGVIVGKAFYEGRVSLEEVSDYVGKANYPVP